MAEFLIQAANRAGELPGDIVEVREDGARYGTRELDPARFYIVKVPGLPIESVKHLNEEQFDPLFYDPDHPTDKKRLARRRHTIDNFLGSLGPFHITGNIYQINVQATFTGAIRDKAG